MRIELSGHHLDITDSIRDAVKQKLSKIESHYPQIESCTVILTVEKNEQKAEITTQYMSTSFSVDASHNDLYSAVADAAKKLDASLSHKKGATKSQRHKGPRLADAASQKESPVS